MANANALLVAAEQLNKTVESGFKSLNYRLENLAGPSGFQGVIKQLIDIKTLIKQRNPKN